MALVLHVRLVFRQTRRWQFSGSAIRVDIAHPALRLGDTLGELSNRVCDALHFRLQD